MGITSNKAPAAVSPQRGVRRLEWFTVALGLLVHSGAVFPLLMQGADGVLDDPERAKLRLLYLPVYGLSFALLAMRPRAVIKAGLRNLPMMLLLILPIISILWSMSPSLSLRRAVALILSMGFVFLFATRFTPRQQIVAVGWVLGSTIVLSLIAAVAWPSLAYMPDDGAMRGVFYNKNVFGWISAVLIIAGIAGRQDDSPRMRQLGTAMLLLGWTGCLLSTSMTSLFMALSAVGISQIVLMLIRRKGISRLVLQLGIILSLVLLGLVFSNGMAPVLDALGRDATLTGRIPLWSLIDVEITKHPIVGYGYGAFWSSGNLAMWNIWEAIGWQAPHAHSGYRDLLLGIGIVGLCVFAVVALQAITQSLALCAIAPQDGWLWSAVLILSVLIMNLTETTLLVQNDIAWVLFSTAVLTTSYHYARMRQPLPRFLRVAHAAT